MRRPKLPDHGSGSGRRRFHQTGCIRRTVPERSRRIRDGDAVDRRVAARDYSDVIDAGAKEELGRMALSYVGADPLADEVWVWLINDPELAPKVREDLNRGPERDRIFPTGTGVGPRREDLPLIESRIVLLEEHSPFAMDAVNAAAFAEAYKDLVEMWWRLSE
jgi:hypothetical protein